MGLLESLTASKPFHLYKAGIVRKATTRRIVVAGKNIGTACPVPALFIGVVPGTLTQGYHTGHNAFSDPGLDDGFSPPIKNPDFAPVFDASRLGVLGADRQTLGFELSEPGIVIEAGVCSGLVVEGYEL